MIRKFCAIIILILTSLWFILAYTVKGKIVDFLNDIKSDNIGLNYENIKVGGFPTKWVISIYDPKITFITPINSYELSANEVIFTINLNLDSININFGNNITYKNANGIEKSELYFIDKDSLNMRVNFLNYSSLFSDNLFKQVNSIIFNSNLLNILDKDKNSIFDISSINILTKKNQDNDKEKISIILSGKYKNVNKNTANLNLDLDYISDIKEGSDKNIIVKNTKLEIGDSVIDINGSLNFLKNKPPIGTIALGMKNYQYIVNNLFSDNSIFSRVIVKQIMEKATDGENVMLDLLFSEDGISIDNVQILKLKSNFENNRGMSF